MAAPRSRRVQRIALAAGSYFLFVFGIGFLLGPVRVLWLEPRFGRFVAVVIESPFLLAAMAVAAAWTARHFGLRQDRRSLIAVGIAALALQQIADLAVGWTTRSMTVAEQFAAFATPEGLVYAALLAAFAMMPVLIAGRRPAASGPA